MKKRIQAPKGRMIHLGEVAHLLAQGDEEKLKRLPVARFQPGNSSVMMVEWMDVVRVLRQIGPEWDFRQIGPPHTIVEQSSPLNRSRALLVFPVWLLLFVGSGLAIMNFHADVSMLEVHQRIHYLLTGVESERPLLLQIPYSLGIGLGMLIFFNHVWKRKLNEEPTPLELEVFLYQENIDQYFVDHEKAKRAGSHDSSG
ncbi:stage V sporulation protein AA [Desmospora profundinema]|uniref:Stage V sporulation protein AA n=2 Tax=Desmospora profundinema TaxID=1571184 RepID=A0ABU1IIG7_9BACL|nr:stage V sporulation protein AA [Desmospora profundinema]